MSIDPTSTWPAQFQTHALLHNFTPAQLEFLGRSMTLRRYQPGAEVVREGEMSDELYFITAGEVELLKYDDAKQQQYPIGVLHQGAAFGEIAFINAAPRTCTIQAVADVEMLVLARAALEQQAPQSTPLLNQLQANIAQQLAGTLQDRTSAYVFNLQAQVTMLREMNEFGKFFIGTVMGFSVATLMNVVLHTYINMNAQNSSLIAWVYLILMLLPIVYFIYQSDRPWRDFGVTWANWPKVTLQALGISAVLLTILSLAVGGYALATGRTFLSLFAFRDGLLITLLYLPHSYLQELIGRGAMQNSLQRFLRNQHPIRAVIWSSIIFAMIHSHYGLTAILLTFISGLLFGFLFVREQNLIGVTIVHWFLGLWAFSLNLL